MEHDQSDLKPVFDGVPVLVRLVNGDDVICVLYLRDTDGDIRMFMERPLRLFMNMFMNEIETEPTMDRKNVMYSKVRTRFDRWMPMTQATIFPIYPDYILSIAPLADQYVHPYMEWATSLYETPEKLSEKMEKETPSIEDVRRSYIDFILHNFNGKGKPN
jgi:hypothetical protein